MTIDLLDRVLSLGASHSCCVDLRPTPAAPAYVRRTTLLDGHRLSIKFEQWGWDEGGLYYWASFGSLAEAVAATERYLGRPLADWQSHEAAYPPRPAEADTDGGHRQWLALLAAGGPDVPAGGGFTGSSFWLQFLPQGHAEPGAAVDGGA